MAAFTFGKATEGSCPCPHTSSHMLAECRVQRADEICGCFIMSSWCRPSLDRRAVQFHRSILNLKDEGVRGCVCVCVRGDTAFFGLCALPVSLATAILTCCSAASAAAGSWRAARKHPACTQSHILPFCQHYHSGFTQFPSHFFTPPTPAPDLGGSPRPAERRSED